LRVRDLWLTHLIEGFRVTGKAIEEWKKEQEAKGTGVEEHTDIGLDQRLKEDE